MNTRLELRRDGTSPVRDAVAALRALAATIEADAAVVRDEVDHLPRTHRRRRWLLHGTTLAQAARLVRRWRRSPSKAPAPVRTPKHDRGRDPARPRGPPPAPGCRGPPGANARPPDPTTTTKEHKK
jgi:hypothetical protein